MWIAVFLRMARQFNWIDAVITPEQNTRLASVAKNKLIGKARSDEEEQKQTFGILSQLLLSPPVRHA
jgi:hypothetical protein